MKSGTGSAYAKPAIGHDFTTTSETMTQPTGRYIQSDPLMPAATRSATRIRWACSDLSKHLETLTQRLTPYQVVPRTDDESTIWHSVCWGYRAEMGRVGDENSARRRRSLSAKVISSSCWQSLNSFGDEPGRVDTERAGQSQQHGQGWAT